MGMYLVTLTTYVTLHLSMIHILLACIRFLFPGKKKPKCFW